MVGVGVYNLADLYRIDALRVHCLQIGLNRDVFWPMLEQLRSVGRPPELNEADTHTLSYAWQAPQEKHQASALSAADYLKLREQTGIALRAIWVLIKRWETYGGEMSAESSARAAEHGS